MFACYSPLEATRTTETTTPTSTFADTVAELHRLVGLVPTQRVYPIQDGHGAWFPRSTLDRTAHLDVTGLCPCPAFIHEQACPLHARLLARLGWLPPLASTEAAAPSTRSPPRAVPHAVKRPDPLLRSARVLGLWDAPENHP
jgi:hypothetical protein